MSRWPPGLYIFFPKKLIDVPTEHISAPMSYTFIEACEQYLLSIEAEVEVQIFHSPFPS